MLVAVSCVYGPSSESWVGMSNDQPKLPCNCDEAKTPVDRRKGRTPVCYHLFGQEWWAGPSPDSELGRICHIADGLWADVRRVNSTNLRVLIRELLRAVALSGFGEFRFRKFGLPCPRHDPWPFPRWAPYDLRDPYP